MAIHLPLPSSNQLNWQRAETNLFIHFTVNTYTGREWGDGTESPSIFNPTELDCREWAKTAKAAGFKICILTAKHHDGFCLWPSKYTDHSVKSSPWKNGEGDVVREFVDAFRAEGLKVGLYLSPWDRHERSYGSEKYNDHYCNQLTELLTEYGELYEVWFDGACAEGPNGKKQVYDWDRYFDTVRKLQPKAVTFGDGGTDVRWVGNERGIAGETCWGTVNAMSTRFPGDSGISQANDARASVSMEQLLNEGEVPDGKGAFLWRPAECDVSIRPGWFYHAEENEKVRTVDNLVDLYFQSVGRNGTLLLNIPPRSDGQFEGVDAERVIAFRKKLDSIFSCDLAQGAKVKASSEEPGFTSQNLLDGNVNTYWKVSGNTGSVEVELSTPANIGIICLQEAIQVGQRISSFHVEIKNGNGIWEKVWSGTTVGCKRLSRITPVLAQSLRITVESSLDYPCLNGISLFAPDKA